MAGPSFSVTVKGIQNAIGAFKMLDTTSRTRTRGAVGESLAEAKGIAVALVARRSGELAATIRTDMPPDTSGVFPVGYLQAGYGTLKRRSRSTGKHKVKHRTLTLANTQPGVYAMVEEFGDAARNHAAHPFMVPAAEETRPHHLERMAKAMTDSVDAAAIAGRSGS